MASRMSMMHPRVEELGGGSPSSASPLRRRSSIAQKTITTSLIENDDEAEIRVRRREKNPAQQTATANDRRRSLGLGFVSQMSHPQIAEKVQQCIQLSAENKINLKNAFSLQMIDFMTYMIKKRDTNMNNLQVASTSLDVSTKIYGLRVDGMHMDILKMSGGLEKQDKKDDKDGPDDTGEPGEDNAEAQSRERAKKKRKNKQKIIVSAESLRGPTETINPASTMMGAGDTQTTDMLHLATIPYHADRGVYLHLYNEVLLDTINPDSQSNNSTISCPRIGNYERLEMCASLGNFDILGWSVDDEAEELSPAEPSPVENGFQFDLDASLPADVETSNRDMNYFDIEDDEVVEGCERVGQPPANIVDFREVLQASTRKQNFEYSYFQDNMDIQWAGPSHWKIRHPTRSLTSSRIVGRCHQEPIKRKKELIIAYNNEAETVAKAKFEIAKGSAVKLQAKTAKATWSEEKLTLPEDMHYNVSQTCQFYLRNEVLVTFSNKEDLNTTNVSDDIGNYDYNNEHDTTDYCPNIGDDDQQEAPDGVANSEDAYEENVGVCTQAFVGDNLVELPKMTNGVALAFTHRAKKIDMRQLKKAIWRNLTSAGIIDKENLDAADPQETENREKINGTLTFGNIFEELPKTLTKNNIEALSLPIAFISLLHLANEKTLQIDSLDDKSDLYIRQG